MVNEWKLENNEFEHKLYDKGSREEFIKTNFSKEVYSAYSRIKPGAFKADLWRYCILFKYGGFYADIDTLCLGGLDQFIDKNIDFVAPIDLNYGDNGYHNVANAFIGCTPNHPVINNCIKRILYWVETETFPTFNLDFAGPGCLGRSINKFLGRNEDDSVIGLQGNLKNIVLLYFEPHTEFIRGLDKKKILQNKNGNPILKTLYDNECEKVTDFIDWGLGHRGVQFKDAVGEATDTIEDLNYRT
jgi:hypothetical protein